MSFTEQVRVAVKSKVIFGRFRIRIPRILTGFSLLSPGISLKLCITVSFQFLAHHLRRNFLICSYIIILQWRRDTQFPKIKGTPVKGLIVTPDTHILEHSVLYSVTVTVCGVVSCKASHTLRPLLIYYFPIWVLIFPDSPTRAVTNQQRHQVV
jgi:hypothetical protein